MSRLSGSSRNPRSTLSSPMWSQFSGVAVTSLVSNTVCLNIRNRPQLTRKVSTTAEMESCALNLPSRLVNSPIAAAASNGRNRMIQATSSGLKSSNMRGSEFHRSEVLDVCSLALAVERDDERQAHRHFRRRHGDDEENHDLAVEVVVEPREGDEREVGRVEH